MECCPARSPGADPELTLLTRCGGVSVLALMLLYLLTSVTVIVFFRRTRLDERIWHTMLAPPLAIALLCGATVLALACGRRPVHMTKARNHDR